MTRYQTLRHFFFDALKDDTKQVGERIRFAFCSLGRMKRSSSSLLSSSSSSTAAVTVTVLWLLLGQLLLVAVVDGFSSGLRTRRLATFRAVVNGDGTKEEDTMTTSTTTLGRSGYTTEGYSQFLQKRFAERMMERAERIKEDQEDGWGDLFDKRRSFLRKLVKFPFRIAKRVLLEKPREPGTLILVRHGESLWNANKTFTGWADPDLSQQGCREVEHAAR